jgi:hypothetical protein
VKPFTKGAAVIMILFSKIALGADARTAIDPFYSWCLFPSSSPFPSLGCTLPDKIPAGKRLVIETVSGAIV